MDLSAEKEANRKLLKDFERLEDRLESADSHVRAKQAECDRLISDVKRSYGKLRSQEARVEVQRVDIKNYQDQICDLTVRLRSEQEQVSALKLSAALKSIEASLSMASVPAPLATGTAAQVGHASQTAPAVVEPSQVPATSQVQPSATALESPSHPTPIQKIRATYANQGRSRRPGKASVIKSYYTKKRRSRNA